MANSIKGGADSTAPRTFSDLIRVYGYLYIAKIVALIIVALCVIILSNDIISKAYGFFTYVITIFVDMLILQKKSSFTLLTRMDAIIRTYNIILALLIFCTLIVIALLLTNEHIYFGETISAMISYTYSLYSNVVNFVVFPIALISPCLEFIYAIPEED